MKRTRPIHDGRSLATSAVTLFAAVVLGATACGGPSPRPGSSPTAAASDEASRPVAYLIRHAEKQAGPDPSLTAAGRTRAEAIAARLERVGVRRILSTDTRRTRETAEPLARRTGIEIELYDHRKLEDLAVDLRSSGRTALVVGHSNTTPRLVRLLGGDSGRPIADDEYDHLYRVDLIDGTTDLERTDAAGPAAP